MNWIYGDDHVKTVNKIQPAIIQKEKENGHTQVQNQLMTGIYANDYITTIQRDYFY